MREELFMAGTGGHGVLLAGKILTQAVADTGLAVSWVPMYSPEVRGGTTTCTIIISDGRVGSPLSGHPSTTVLLDARSVDAHLSQTASGGISIINTPLTHDLPAIEGIQIVGLPATEIARELGNERTVNMVMLGAYIALRPIVTVDQITAALKKVLPERHHGLIGLNAQAIHAGAEAIGQALR